MLYAAPNRGVGLSAEPSLNSHVRGGRLDLEAAGPWTAAHAGELERLVERAVREASGAIAISIDMRGVASFDTFGAWLLERLLRAGPPWRPAGLIGLRPEYQHLLGALRRGGIERAPAPEAQDGGLLAPVAGLGRAVVEQVRDLSPAVNLLGALGSALGRVIARPASFRLTSAVNQLDRVGFRAVPIILLITFLIGCIISQQGFFHFRKFGADSYVVDMVGILILREIGVLIVAIMVAGRSGSSYTAELGSMKMREEIDALRTMGLDPVEVLILPRILALIIALPILTFLGSMAALYGAGLVAWLYGDMSPTIFIDRLRQDISVTHFKVGMIKAPFMALVIGVVACSEGLLVKGSAESLGLQTTVSVVKSIFLVIVLDGLFAIFFASIGL
jgi:phospholipid/cholesterol/gamma-HCH transport system permease protein